MTAGKPINVRVNERLRDALTQFRREQDEIPGEPEAIRRILRDWLIGNGYLALDEDEKDPKG
jgi:hypothetical protein